MRIVLALSYIGTNYHGWQRQDTTQQTIQGVLEKALSVFFRQPIAVIGAGRTDAGVHAAMQFAHADIPACELDRLQTSLNALLPKDIAVTQISPTRSDFHARFDAKQKTYHYHFWTNPRFILPHRRPYVWAVGALNQKAICQALPLLVGTHDFASLQNAGADTQTTIRTIYTAQYLPLHADAADEYTLCVCANGFLKQMVRNIAGVLAAIGKGKLAPNDLKTILCACSRTKNPCQTAPAHGLLLHSIRYTVSPENAEETREQATDGVDNQ